MISNECEHTTDSNSHAWRTSQSLWSISSSRLVHSAEKWPSVIGGTLSFENDSGCSKITRKLAKLFSFSTNTGVGWLAAVCWAVDCSVKAVDALRATGVDADDRCDVGDVGICHTTSSLCDCGI